MSMNSGRLTAEDLILLRGSASNVQSFRNLSDFDGSYQSSIVLPGDTAPHRLVAEWERLGKSFYLPPRIPPARALPNSPGGNLPSVHMPNHSLMGPPIGGSMASLIGPAMTPSIGPALEPVGVNDLSDTGSPSVPIELQSYRPHLITDVDLALPDSSIMSSMTADVIGASSSITARSDSRFSLMENQVLEDITDTGDPLRRGLEYLCNWIESLNGQPGVLPQYRTIEFAQEQSYGRKRKVAAKSAAGFTIDVLTEAGPTGRKVAATLIKHCFVLQRWKDGTICAIGHDERDQPKAIPVPAHLIRTAVFIVDQPQNWNVANTDVSYCTRRIKTGGTLVISLVGIDTISYPAAAANGDLGKAVDAALGLNVGTYLLACWDDILESLSSYASPFKIGHP